MKTRSSTKIVVGFALLTALGYTGYHLAMRQAIASARFDPVIPGDVNLVGVDAGAGYKVIVANQMAQLVQASDEFGGKESSEGGATEGAIKKRIPIREMLAVLRGDSEAVGTFVMTMNDMSENDLPPVAPVWKAEDLRKALDGDATLEAKLVRDLNMKLDGTPLTQLRIASLENGIVIDSPVFVTVNLKGKLTKVEGRVKEAYRPRLLKAVEVRYAEKSNLTREMQAGFYQEEAAQVLQGKADKENIRKSIESVISTRLASDRVRAAERVLKSATVVVNDSHITEAASREYDTSDGKRYDLTIRMSDEGSRRLWKYSSDKVGTQILLISDGVAIDAPRISHELRQGELTITQMRDRVLVEDAVRMLKKKSQESASR
ncbi:MAG: SecDF P1 head subdomain-containing protein [Fimbriimonas sp.]